jgi:sulfite reductase (NADPH) hemoprotein beta-component
LPVRGWIIARSPIHARSRSRRIDAPLRQSRHGEHDGRRINISGCINACGHHHVGHIGILGVEKNGEEFYQITIGGRADESAQMGTLIGPAVPYVDVADVIEDIVEAYLALRARPDELFVDTVKRLGVEPFRERVYATR